MDTEVSELEELGDEASVSGLGEPSVSATVDVSLLNHEKDVLLEKTKAQENEIMSLRLKVEAFEKEKQEFSDKASVTFSHEDKTALEQEIGVLRGKVALLERNNRVFSNEERTELKRELERTKRRFERLNDQLASVRNSMEYDHINHVERALENFVKKVKTLEKENNDLRKMNIGEGTDKSELSAQMIEEKEEIIKDQNVLIEELEHQIKALKSSTNSNQLQRSFSKLDDSGQLLNRTGVIEDTSQEVELPTSRRSSPLRTGRSRLSSNRSCRSRSRFKSPRSRSGSFSSSSDSDAKAIREMCGKMREDIEKAKKRLKDMGADLDVLPHLSPTHPRASPLFESARNLSPAVLRKDQATSPRSAERKPLDEDVSAIQILTQQYSSPRGKSTTTMSTTEPQSTARSDKLTSSSVPSIQIPSPFQSGRENFSTTRLNTWPASKEGKGVTMDDGISPASYSHQVHQSADFLRLLSRYEFLRIRALDHKFLEFQQECRHVAMLELLKLQHQTKIENSDLHRNIPTHERKTAAGPKAADSSPSKDIPKLCLNMDNDPIFPKPDEVPNVPPSYARYYSLPENANVRAAAYRIYVAKKEYNPPEEETKENKNTFSKVKLCVGDIVTSLGAPHTREDGKRYQLVEVNNRIGLVPYSFLQLAEEVDDPHRSMEVGKLQSLNPKNLRRIAEMHRKIELRRRVVPEIS